MDIEVRLFADLQRDRFRRKTLEFPQGSTVADVCGRLSINPEEAAIRMVNGVATDADHALRPGDVLALFPAIGGG